MRRRTVQSRVLAAGVFLLTASLCSSCRAEQHNSAGGGKQEAVQKAALKKTSKAFSAVAKQATPAVVYIEVKKTVEVGRRNMPFNDPFDLFGDDFMRKFFGPGRQPRQREFQRRGAGTGFIISDDGYILSNYHVVGEADEITVKLHDGREFDAKKVGVDPKSEVAVIKIDAEDLPYLELGDSSAIEVGEWVVAIGNPFGLTETLTVGVVSAKGRSNIGIADYEDFIQTDAAINPGNSGGPLLTVDGKVIGVNTAIFSRTGGYMGIGFAVPINMARNIKNQLIEKGEVTRSFLGVYIQEVTPELADSFGLKEAYGVLVSQVEDGSGADNAGLRSGDIILELNGKKIKDIGKFRNSVASNPPGSELDLTVFRDGKKEKITAVTGEFPGREEKVAAGTGSVYDRLGFTVTELTGSLAERLGYETGKGVVVDEVETGSNAARAGIRPGVLIESVNRQKVETVEDFKKALAEVKNRDSVLLLVKTPRGSRFVLLALEPEEEG
jgi:serine protease Do